MPPKAKAKIVKDVTQLVLARRTRMCNFLEYKGENISYTMEGNSTRPDLVGRPCFRHESGVSAVCVVVLRLRDRIRRQRVDNPRDYTSIRGSSG